MPRQLAPEIQGHLVRTVQQEAWAGIGNGELLRRAAARAFEVFVTADQSLQFQQNVSGSGLAVILLVAPTNKLEDLTPLVPALLNAIRDARPGDIQVVSAERH